MEKILIVDDDQELCRVLKDFFVSKKYRVDVALNGEEAIEKVKGERPHIVLLDIKMPGIDGVEALKRIKKIDKEVGVIMITKVVEDDIGKKCMDLGAYDYITKPFGLEYLEGVVLTKLIDYFNREKDE